MAFFFGDSYDLYAASSDAVMAGTYWDSGTTTSITLAAGRFSGSQAIQIATTGQSIVKSSGVNDAVHHFVVAFQQTAALSGTTAGMYIELFDGATAQCSVVFRSDGAILLTAGGPTGTTLATYTGAVTAASTWYGFEIEVVINSTTGSIAVRKNGNTSNDFSLGSLNTRASANNYANKIQIGMQAAVSAQLIDDFLWRSDASSVAWVGDVRAYVRRPASDASIQWTPSTAVLPLTPFAQTTNASSVTNTARYTPFTPPITGSIGTVTIPNSTANAGNIKCSIFSAFGSAPGTPLGSATPLSNIPAGTNTFTFSTPVPVTAGTSYWIGFITDTVVTNFWPTNSASTGVQQAGTTYAAFPTTNPSTAATTAISCTLNLSPTGNPNTAMVMDTVQDGAATYVYSSTVSQSDLYGLSSLSATPTTVVGCVTRALCQKSDAGTRNVQTQLKSGGTTSSGTSTALNTTWGWIWQANLTDPATGAAWTATGVNNAQIGQVVTA